jgi:PPK2 family polyphosphate:nucleotide phosphotransferase
VRYRTLVSAYACATACPKSAMAASVCARDAASGVDYSEIVLGSLRVEPGHPAHIAERDPRDALGLEKDAAKARLDELHGKLSVLHNRLFAEGKHGLLLVLQGLDAAGKDGVIRSVFTGVNPQGCRVVSFKAPSTTELQHDYLWRVHAVLPARGEIAIFNRSHYEDIVAVRMLKLATEDVWKRRSTHIREFERELVDEGTTIVKVFLNVSKDEQRTRLQERVDDPEKRWKLRLADLDVRKQFDDYVAAWDEAITETSTDWAPWYVVPADRNWVKALAVAELLVDALERLDPKLPEAEPGVEGLTIE